MREVVEYRANRILYNFIKCNDIHGMAIVPANTCLSVIDTLLFSGMQLCFVDINKETLCADRSSVLANASNASLFLFVHSYGVEMESPSWFSEVKVLNPNIAIVEDCCLCLPKLSFFDTSGDLLLFSFCPKKQVDLGLGGIGYLSDKWKYNSLYVERNPYLNNEKWSPNYRQIEEQTQRVLEHKRILNEIYSTSLPPSIQLDSRFQNWRFNVLVSNKKEIVLKKIFDAGLFASSHYSSKSSLCPIALSLHGRIINLFNDLYFTEEQAQQTCRVINSLIVD